MAGHRNFNEIRAKMAPESRARAKRAANAELEHMMLSELRKLVGVTQVQVAAEMGVGQSALSQLESQDDMQISTLRRIIEALGGELNIVAKLPGRTVPIRLSKADQASVAEPTKTGKKDVSDKRRSTRDSRTVEI